MSLFAYHSTEEFQTQRLSALIGSVTGLIQLLTILAMCVCSLYPSKPHIDDRLWLIRCRAVFFLTMNMLGLVIGPVAALVVAIAGRDLASMCYLWNIVYSFNSLFLFAALFQSTIF